MNGGLIGSILLLGYAIYSGYDAKTQNLDWTPLLNAKVWGGGLVGMGSLLYNVKDNFKAYWDSLPGLNGFEKTKVDKTILVDNKVEVVASPEVAELDLNSLELEDSYCLTYLMKRVKRAKSEEGLKLLKALHDEFYNIHSGEVKEVA